jgi:hypothetical protein
MIIFFGKNNNIMDKIKALKQKAIELRNEIELIANEEDSQSLWDAASSISLAISEISKACQAEIKVITGFKQ